MSLQPEVSLYDCQKAHPVDLNRLLRAAEAALPLALDASGLHQPGLADQEEVEITVVDDETIGRVHDEFLGDPEPTDVITFQHGEILVSADTAARVGPGHGNSVDRELALYLIHGLLHLNGHQDKDPGEAAVMKEVQERILNTVWPL